MSYEVIKKVGSRSYRYIVDSIRDPQSGKRTARWTYIGPVDSGAKTLPAPRSATTRDDLIAAFQGLLETRRLKTLTVEIVARRARVTHATFYRYFKNMQGVLVAAIARAQESLPSLDLHVTGNAEAEREKIRSLITNVFEQAAKRSGLLNAFIGARSESPLLQTLWDAHNRRLLEVWTIYIRELNEHGLGTQDDAATLAGVVVLCIQARLHDAILRKQTLSLVDGDLWTSVVARLILR